MWLAQNFSLKADFATVIRENFNAQLSAADFQSQQTALDINGWVEKMTKGEIKELVTDIDPDTQLFLANTLYFRENWRFPFEMNNLAGTPLMEDFHFQEGQTAPVKMMKVVSRHIQYEEFQLPGTSQGFALIRIPYENKDSEMLIILPKTTGRYLELKVLETYLNLIINMDQTREKNIFRIGTIKANYSVSVLVIVKKNMK